MTVTFGAEFTVENTIVTAIASALVTTVVNTFCVQFLNCKNNYLKGFGFFLSILALAMYYLLLLIQTALKSADDQKIVSVWIV